MQSNDSANLGKRKGILLYVLEIRFIFKRKTSFRLKQNLGKLGMLEKKNMRSTTIKIVKAKRNKLLKISDSPNKHQEQQTCTLKAPC